MNLNLRFIKEKLVPKISGDEKIWVVSHSVIMSSLADGDSKEEKELTLRHAWIAVGSSLDFKFIPVQQ